VIALSGSQGFPVFIRPFRAFCAGSASWSDRPTSETGHSRVPKTCWFPGLEALWVRGILLKSRDTNFAGRRSLCLLLVEGWTNSNSSGKTVSHVGSSSSSICIPRLERPVFSRRNYKRASLLKVSSSISCLLFLLFLFLILQRRRTSDLLILETRVGDIRLSCNIFSCPFVWIPPLLLSFGFIRVRWRSQFCVSGMWQGWVRALSQISSFADGKILNWPVHSLRH